MIDKLIQLFPYVLTLILLFLPDHIYKIATQQNVQNLLKNNGISGHSKSTNLEKKIKSNFDFIGFSSSSVNFIFVVFYSLNKNVYNVYQLDGCVYSFVMLFLLCWFILLIKSISQLKKGKQPSLWQKILIVSAVLFNAFIVLR